VHVGQHAIVDTAGSVAAYELLFRGSATATAAHVRDADAATAEVLVATFLDFGLRELVGDGLAFVNLPRSFLVGSRPVPFAPEQVVLEVLEDVQPDASVLAGLDRLRERGYAIALDDVTPDRYVDPLLPLADYVKVDVAATPPDALPTLVNRLAGDGRCLLAEKVERPEQLETCLGLGFELFQGYLFSRPRTRSASDRSLTADQVSRLRLLSLLARPEAPLDEVLSAVQMDPALCLQVLRASNAVAAGVAQRVDSVEQAVLLLGRRRLQGWVVLMSLGGSGSEVPLTAALVRARMSQLLAAREVRGANPHAAFLVGMLSALAEPLGVALPELAGQLPLSADVSAALRGDPGPLSRVLSTVLTWEHRQAWDDARALPRTESTRRAYLAAVAWTREARESLLAA
jgi:EAL and modified HD-GYP domain-containing signal transduction protein